MSTEIPNNYHQINDPQINTEYFYLGTNVNLDEESFEILRDVRFMLPPEFGDRHFVELIPFNDGLIDHGPAVRSLAQSIEGLDAIDPFTGKITVQKIHARTLAQLGVLFDTASVYDAPLDEKTELIQINIDAGEQDAMESFERIHQKARLNPDLLPQHTLEPNATIYTTTSNTLPKPPRQRSRNNFREFQPLVP